VIWIHHKSPHDGGYQLKLETASCFFRDLLQSKKDKPLSKKAQREYQTLLALFRSAPGQDLPTAKGTLWGAVNAVTYYTDHVVSASAGEALDKHGSVPVTR
jgi:hypothetical protein